MIVRSEVKCDADIYLSREVVRGLIFNEMLQGIRVLSHHIFEFLVENFQHLIWFLPTILILLQKFEGILDVICS